MGRTLLKNEALASECLFLQAGDLETPACGQENNQCPVSELKASLQCERNLVNAKEEVILRHELLSREADHRLSNSLQMISGLLTMQARSAATEEISAQLVIAAARVAALGRIHQRLHSPDGATAIAFKPYLEGLCYDMSAMLWFQGITEPVCVNADDIMVTSKTAVPLGFIANELITNAAKYGGGTVSVTLQRRDARTCALSVANDGPALPSDFSLERSKGLGMKIIGAFTEQIAGELVFGTDASGAGARFTIVFPDSP